MIEQDDEGHVVNTASMAGMMTGGGNAMYGVTKHGVVALSEHVWNELAMRGSKIRVSVLCPGWVNTNILDSERNRPAELADTLRPPETPQTELMRKYVEEKLRTGADPAEVGELVLGAIREQRFYVFTHPWKAMIEARMRNILDERDPIPTPPPGTEGVFGRRQ
jgi:short-subunit dehydrogenase